MIDGVEISTYFNEYGRSKQRNMLVGGFNIVKIIFGDIIKENN